MHRAHSIFPALNIFGLEGHTRARTCAGMVAGLLLALAFPNAGVAGLGWVAPGALLGCAAGVSGREAFRIGYWSGLVFHLVSLSWLLYIPMPVGAVLGWLALSAFLSLYPALWVRLCWEIFPAKAPENSASFSRLPSWMMQAALPQRAAWAWHCAVVWTALEMVRGRFLTGFPWNYLGASQFQMLPVIQIAEWTGILGVSFLMVWFSTALLCAAALILSRPTLNKAWIGDMLLPMAVLAAAVTWGVGRISQPQQAERTLKAALIQPSIPQTLIWDPKESANRFRQLIALSERALTNKADLLVWPEAAVPNLLRYEPETYEQISKLAVAHSVWVILGADDAEPRPGGVRDRDFDYFNSSFLIDPEGRLRATYKKRRLVIFGEYMPFVRWLPFLKHLLPVGDGFRAGAGPVPFSLAEPAAKCAVLICFEDVFPHIAREYVEEDTDFMVNITNNGWFGESAAQWQHAASAVFRAIENRRPLVRCANNGLTCLVDERGAVSGTYFPGTRDIYGAGYKMVEVPLRKMLGSNDLTFYTRHGDVFGWACLGLGVAIFLPKLLKIRPR